MSVNLEAALELAASGWAVFPCVPAGPRAKSPLLTHGHLDASRDAEQIGHWWARWPDAMIGAPVPDAFLVVDIDPRNGGSVDELEALTGERLADTLTAWSGRNDGGRHLYFQRPPGALTAARLPHGIDLKANGYCIVPPSTHPATGLPYRWDQRPAATVPVGLRELLRPQPVRTRSTLGRRAKSGQSLVDFVARFQTDGVNNALYWAALRASENGLIDDIGDELVHMAVSVGETRTQAEKTVKSARAKILGVAS